MNSENCDDSPEQARVSAAQQLLLPDTPQAVCEQIGLNWWAALKLGDDEWLSFDPEATQQLDEAQEAELRFVGSMVVAGCDPAMLKRLLSGLHKPYSYDGGRIYYDWRAGRWRLVPERIVNPDDMFSAWLEELKEDGDVRTLERLTSDISFALTSLQSPS